MVNLKGFISNFGGVIGNHPFLINKFLKSAKPEDPDNPTDDEKAAANNSTKEAYISMAFLSGLNRGRYVVVLNDLHNAFWVGCYK